MLKYPKNSVKKICEWLSIPSLSSEEDFNRRKELYKLLNLDNKNNKYLPGKLGECIVKIYYEITNKNYKSKPEKIIVEGFNNILVGICPDGLLEENDKKYCIEIKTRGYCSSGTAHEKIPSIPWKYQNVPNKIIIFLLADDENLNKEYVSLINDKIKPKNTFQKKFKIAMKEKVEKIITGTEIVKELRKIYE